MAIAIAVVLLLAVVVVYDLVQRKHAILRNFPIVGHFRYLLESVGRTEKLQTRLLGGWIQLMGEIAQRGIAEGDIVMIATVSKEDDPTKKKGEKYLGTHFDMFRIENGKIAEHWDSVPKNPAKLHYNPNTQNEK